MFGMLENVMNEVFTGDKSVSQINDVGGVVTLAANIFVIIGFGLAITALAISFIQFAVSTGDKEATDKAKSSLLWAGIGFFLVLAAYTIKGILLKLMGITMGT